jgi:hypothetical protein
MHPAYKHLRDRLRIAELTVPQIAGLFAGLMSGLMFALYLSPFSPYLTLCLSIYIASIPAGTVLLATSTEFDLWLYIRACVGEWRSDGRYTAGPGHEFTGYVIEPAEASGRPQNSERDGPVDLEELWTV